MNGTERAAGPWTRGARCTARTLTWLVAQPVLTGCSAVASLPARRDLRSPRRVEEAAGSSARGGAHVIARARRRRGHLLPDGREGPRGSGSTRLPRVPRRGGGGARDALAQDRLPPRAGTVTFSRPCSHMLCFSKGVRPDLAKSTAEACCPTQAKSRGRAAWAWSVSARLPLHLEQTSTRTVVDPFCSHGTALAVANAMGLRAVGVGAEPQARARPGLFAGGATAARPRG